jgi:hypothetical protein
VCVCHEVYKPADHDDPGQQYDLLTTAYKGQIMHAMLAAHHACSETNVEIYKKPEAMLVVTKGFAVGAFKLAPLATTINFCINKNGKSQVPASAVDMGTHFEVRGEAVRAYVKPCMTFPKGDGTNFVIAYWAAALSGSFDPAVANCENTVQEITCKVGNKITMKVTVPTIVNTKVLKPGDKIMVMMQERVAEEPSCKRDGSSVSSGMPTPKAAKTKGKGKGTSSSKK